MSLPNSKDKFNLNLLSLQSYTNIYTVNYSYLVENSVIKFYTVIYSEPVAINKFLFAIMSTIIDHRTNYSHQSIQGSVIKNTSFSKGPALCILRLHYLFCLRCKSFFVHQIEKCVSSTVADS